MRKYIYTCACVLVAFLALANPARAQARYARAAALPRPGALAMNAAPYGAPAVAAPAAPKTVNGRVEALHGALPGAVVRLASSNQTCVTDAQGQFRFTVPADAGPLAAVVSYAGYTDVSTTLAPGDAPSVVQLLTPVTIKVGKRQELKTYLKTARREVRHDLRQIK